MGALWNVMHPLAMIAIYTLVFSSIMSPRLPGKAGRYSFIIYLCSGIVPWTAFADCVTRGCGALVLNAGYLRKLPIPEPVFVAQEAVAAFVTAAISFVLLLAFGVCVGLPPTWTWLLLPVPLICLLSLGFAIGMLLSTLNVFFRDIQQWVGIALQITMWTAPIVYAAAILPPAYQAVLRWHPLLPSINAVRAMMDGSLPSPLEWAMMFAWPIVFGVMALAVSRRLSDEIRDVI